MEVLTANPFPKTTRSTPVLEGNPATTPTTTTTETKGGDNGATVVTPSTVTPNPTPSPTPSPEPNPTPVKEEPKKDKEWDETCLPCKIRFVAAISFDVLLVFLLAAVIYKLLKPSE